MSTIPASPRRPRQSVNGFFAGVVDMFMHLIDLVVEPLQRRIGVQRMAYFFVLPNMVIFGIFILFPMLLNFYYAFTGGSQLFPQNRPFVGAQNLEILFDCQDFLNVNSCRQDLFWRAAYNLLGFVIFQVGFMVLFALITALALNRQIIGRGFFRGIFFYPVLLSPVVVGLIWKWILQREGLLNAFITFLGGDIVTFLSNPDWARFWAIVVSIWAQMGFHTLILLAGLQSIPKELYEAGEIDGAGNWSRFRFITLPLLMPTMTVVLVLSLIRAVQVFDQVYVLTGGGPGTATQYMVQYIYNIGFSGQTRQYGLAAAASMVLAVVLLVLTLFQLRTNRSTDSDMA